MTREEVVQAALTVERWCFEHRNLGGACDCPFFYNDESCPWYCFLQDRFEPGHWGLEEFLRTRGLKDGSVQ